MYRGEGTTVISSQNRIIQLADGSIHRVPIINIIVLKSIQIEGKVPRNTSLEINSSLEAEDSYEEDPELSEHHQESPKDSEENVLSQSLLEVIIMEKNGLIKIHTSASS